MNHTPTSVTLELTGIAPDDVALSALFIAERAWAHTASVRKERDILRDELAARNAELKRLYNLVTAQAQLLEDMRQARRRREAVLRHRAHFVEVGRTPTDRLLTRLYVPHHTRARYLANDPDCLPRWAVLAATKRLKDSILQHHPMHGPKGVLP